MTREEYRNRLIKLLREVDKLLGDTNFLIDEEAQLDIDTSDPSQVFEQEEANSLLKMFNKCKDKSYYLLRVVQHEGTITMNDWEQYELDGVVLECGTILEVLLYDEQKERYHFVTTSIECDNQGYYLTCNGQHDIKGLKARLRFE